LYLGIKIFSYVFEVGEETTCFLIYGVKAIAKAFFSICQCPSNESPRYKILVSIRGGKLSFLKLLILSL